MKNAFKSLLLAFTTMFAGVVCFAQVTTSTLQGRVVDQNGEPIIGAAILAQHEPSGTVYGAVTNIDGRYTIQGMRTGGPYSVEFSNLGYQSVNYTDITLQLGQPYNLNVWLQESAEFLDAVVVVASPNSKFAAQEKIGAATNISNSDILSLPTASRSITDIAKLSPYGGNGMSFGGGDGRSTNFTVDGANFNNNFGLSDALPGGGMPISMDAIEEVQVVVSPYDVRQSNFIGGGVNAITKSGTNTFKGTGYVYHQNVKLRGQHIDGGQDVVGTANNSTVYGATVGGPIIKNKLFFFGSFEYTGDPREISAWRASEDGKMDKQNSISRTTTADLDRVSKYLMDTYGYDTGGYTNYTKDENNLKLLGRLDWNINKDHHLALRFNYTTNKVWRGTNGNSMDYQDAYLGQSGFRHNGLNRMSEYSMAFVNSMYSQENNVRSYSFDLNSRLSDNMSNQLLITYSNIEDVRGSDSDKFPFIDIMEPYTDEKGTNPLVPYISAGYELFTWYNGVHNRVLNLKDDVTYFMGNHKFTAGLSYEYQFADNAYMREGTGYYRFKSVDDFVNGKAPEIVALTYGYDGEETPSARIRFSQVGVYGQDEWNVDEKLKVTAGVRFDTILYNNDDLMTNQAILDLDFGGKKIDTGLWPKTNIQISPRVGFVYDVFGDKTMKVRGGTGLFAGRLPLVYLTNMPTNAAMYQHTSVLATIYNDDKSIKQSNPFLKEFAAENNGGKLITSTADILAKLNSLDPKNNPTTISPEDGAAQSPVNGVDHNFKMPQVWKTSLALDLQLPVSFPWSMTTEFIFNKTINGTLIQNWNVKENDGWSRFTGPDRRHLYPAKADMYYTNYQAYVLTNTNKGYGWNFNISTNLEPVKNLKMMFSYTHTVQKELTGMPGSNAGSVYTGLPTVDGPNFPVLQNSEYMRPDRLLASVTYRLPSRTTISMLYEGTMYQGNYYTYSNDMNGDGNATDLIYIPTKDHMAVVGAGTTDDVLFATQNDIDLFNAFIDQDEYLSAHRGGYAQAYSVYAPMRHRFDLKLSQDIRIKIGSTFNTFQLSADIMNFANVLNDKWGLSYSFDESVNSGQILTYKGMTENGQPYYATNFKLSEEQTVPKTWMKSHSYTNTWYIQLGLKYLFN